jgi:DNA-binding transcriptional ArsR family regulator
MVGHIDEPDDRSEAVFKALADAGRRRLLDALFTADGQSLGRLGEALPSMTRFGVMKHLAVLEHAGLVVSHREGRTKLHYLNPVPIREIHDRWISKYATATAAAMTELRRHLDSA